MATKLLTFQKAQSQSGSLRGGRRGYFPEAQTNRGPRALVNANVVVIWYSMPVLQAITIHFVLPRCTKLLHHFQAFSKFFSGGESPNPLCHKTKASCNITWHNMYSDGYARGPKLKLPQGPIILSAALEPIYKKNDHKASCRPILHNRPVHLKQKYFN